MDIVIWWVINELNAPSWVMWLFWFSVGIRFLDWLIRNW